jgi:hypothetical protein
MWKNTVERGRPQMTTWRMRITGWIPKATNAHSEYVILITVPRQQWLHERASVLRYTYISCLVYLGCTWTVSTALRLLADMQVAGYCGNVRMWRFPTECRCHS